MNYSTVSKLSAGHLCALIWEPGVCMNACIVMLCFLSVWIIKNSVGSRFIWPGLHCTGQAEWSNKSLFICPLWSHDRVHSCRRNIRALRSASNKQQYMLKGHHFPLNWHVYKLNTLFFLIVFFFFSFQYSWRFNGAIFRISPWTIFDAWALSQEVQESLRLCAVWNNTIIFITLLCHYLSYILIF